MPISPWQTDFPRRDGCASRGQLVGTPRRGVRIGRAVAPRPLPPLRPWEASDGSLRNFTEKTHEEDTVLKTVSPPLMYLFGLSQAPHPMHRRRFSFSAPADVWKVRGRQNQTQEKEKVNVLHELR